MGLKFFSSLRLEKYPIKSGGKKGFVALAIVCETIKFKAYKLFKCDIYYKNCIVLQQNRVARRFFYRVLRHTVKAFNHCH